LRSAWAACALVPTYALCLITIPPASNISLLNFDYGGMVLTEDFNIEINGQGSVINAQVGTLPEPVSAGGDFPWASGQMENTNYCSVNYTTACVSACFGDVVTFSACEGDINQDTYFKLYLGNNSYLPGSNETRGTLVAENDDACGGASSIQYAVSESGCNQFCLNMGCFGDIPCVANVTATRISDLESPRFIYFQQNFNETSGFVPKLTLRDFSLTGFGGDGLNGGSVFLSGSVEATFSYVTFHNSSGGLGGSLYLNDNSETVLIENCTFIYSTAEFGGAVYLDSSVNGFLMQDSQVRHCNGTGGGGGMYIAESNNGVSIVDTLFEECAANSVISASGGGIVIDAYNNDFLLSGVSFLRCSTFFFGGAFASLNFNDNTIITDCVFENCDGEYGGAIFANQFIVGFTIAHTRIDSCKALDGSGGGIYILYDIDQVSIYDVTINNCYAEHHAGALYMFVFVTDSVIIDTVFTNSVAKESGGCMSSRFFNENALLSNVTFANCTSGKQGGCLSVSQYNTVMTVANSSFENCLSYSDGGGINVDINNTFITLDNVAITGSYAADSGGGIGFDTSNNNIVLNNIRITNAQTPSNGGGISFTSDNNNISLADIYISLAVAGGNGGGVYVGDDHANVSFVGITIENVTAGAGGGVYVGARNEYVNMMSVSVTNGHALSSYGGGVYVFEDNVNVSVLASDFTGCSAVSGGGVASHTNNSFLSLAGCTVSDSSAVVFGAGFFVESSNNNMLMTDLDGYYRATTLQSQHPYESGYPAGNEAFTIFSETVSVAGASSFVLNFASSSDIDTTSDFINIYSSSNLSEASLLFSSTSMVWPGVDVPPLLINGDSFYFEFVGTNSFDVSPTTIEDNFYGFKSYVYPVMESPARPTSFSANNVHSGSGGGAYFHSSTNFPVLLNIEFSNNTGKQGGGLFLRDNNDGVAVVQSNFTSNEASFDGGGLTIYVTNYGYILSACLFDGNRAGRAGGGVNFVTGNGGGEFEADNEIKFLRSNFFENSAPNGGAVFSNSDNIAIFEDCRIEDNYATGGSGGGVFIEQDNNFTISNSVIKNNSASGSGGGVSSAVSNTLMLHNANMTANFAGEAGGAVEYQGGTEVVIIGSVLMQRNTARFTGGAIACLSSPLWSMVSNASLTLDSNSASVGSAMFFRDIEHVGSDGSMDSLENMVVSNNVAQTGGTLYWLYDAQMTEEPSGIYSDSVIWDNNQAPYGTVVGTQATSLLGPETYDVTVYGSFLDPPLTFGIYDRYGQHIPLNRTTTVIASIGGDINCGVQYPSLAGQDMTGVGVALDNGLAEFAFLEAYCTPSGNLTLDFVAQLGDLLGISAAVAEQYYVRNSTRLFFRGCIAGESYSPHQCMKCATGTYSLVDNSNLCHDCTSSPGVEECYGDQIFVEEGFYRSSNLSSVEAIMPCPYLHACLGGNVSGAALCAAGYSGPLCKVCDTGYFGIDNVCLPCSGDSLITPTVIGYMIIGIMMLIAGAFAFVFYQKLFKSSSTSGQAENRQSLSELLTFQGSPWQNMVSWMKLNRLQATAKLKIVVATYQIVTACSVVLAVTMPKSFTSFADIASFLNLDFSYALPLACTQNTTFIDHLEMVTLVPMGILAVIICAFWCEYLYFRRIIQANRARRRGDKRRKFEEVRDKYASYFFYLSYIVLPSVTTTIFQMFPCTNMDPQNELGDGPQLFLTADMSISCTSEYYYYGVVYACTMILVYPIGVSLLYFVILYQYREEIRSRDNITQDTRDTYVGEAPADTLDETPNPLRSASDLERQSSTSSVCSNNSDHTSKSRTNSAGNEEAMSQYRAQFNVPINVRRVAFLWAAYQPKFWYWEVIETTRRLMLTAVLSICAPGTSSQGVLSLVLAVFYIRIYSTFQPYTRTTDNALSETGQLQVFFTFFCALIVQNELLSSGFTDALGGCLVLANMGVLIFCVFFIFYSSYSISFTDTETETEIEIDSKGDPTCKGMELTDLSSAGNISENRDIDTGADDQIPAHSDAPNDPANARLEELERLHAEAKQRVKELELELSERETVVS